MRAKEATVGVGVVQSSMPASLFKPEAGEFEYRSRVSDGRTTMEATVEKGFAKSKPNESTAHAAADRSEIGAVSAKLPIRLAARLVDTAAATVLNVGLGYVMGFGFVWVIVGAAMTLTYFVFCDALLGATPGKFALGLRVVGRDGARPSLKQALIRESFTVVGAIPFVGPPLLLAACIWIAKTIRSNPSRQGKHDLLAGGTRVVRAR
jgi:uncharacterized RDD family membrane protein YckC